MLNSESLFSIPLQSPFFSAALRRFSLLNTHACNSYSFLDSIDRVTGTDYIPSTGEHNGSPIPERLRIDREQMTYCVYDSRRWASPNTLSTFK